MQPTMTPPMTSSRSRSRSSSLDSSFDEAYFSKTYVPLSNLPTPPPSSAHSNPTSRKQPIDAGLSRGEVLSLDLLGPATHLTNLIPSSTSLTPTSIPLVHVILTRANLPLETVALAVCILDSLNSRFALSWRQSLPLHPPLVPRGLEFEGVEKQHIDSVHPEIIVLSALVLAVKFIDDGPQSSREYASMWGKDLWTCDQLNFTQRSILENLGYRLAPLWEESIIADALDDMRRAGRQPSLPTLDFEDWETDTFYGSFGSTHNRNMSNGKAVIGNGSMITPAETPMAEIRQSKRSICPKTIGSINSPSKKEEQENKLPTRNAELVGEEPLPDFEETMLDDLDYGFPSF